MPPVYSITSSARAKSPQDWVLGYGLWVLVVIAVIARLGRVGATGGAEHRSFAARTRARRLTLARRRPRFARRRLTD